MALLPATEAAQVLRGLIWPAEGLVPRTLLSAALGTPPRRDLGNHRELIQCVELVPTPYLTRLNPENRCLPARLTGR